jgi:hypothetical protein
LDLIEKYLGKSKNKITTDLFLKKAKALGINTDKKFKKKISKLTPKEKISATTNLSKLIKKR